jgi:hypothetical protein
MRSGSKYLFLTTVFCFLGAALFSQELTDKDKAYFKKFEDSLIVLQKNVFAAKTDTGKFRNNIKFVKLWDEILLNDLSFYYPFDSMKQVSRLVSSDKKVRIITWNLEKADGTEHYFGFVQSKNPKSQHYDLFTLNDKSATIKNPENYVSDNTKWFGMLYYDIIPNDDYYTLLAWDGNDKLVCRKFIDVLSFKSDGTPVFGKDVFKYEKKNPKRVMFEYSAKVTMSLRNNNGAIVFDHLASKDEMNEGMFQFYGPDFSYDAFLPSRGKWVYEADVDVKNPRNKNDNAKRGKTKEKTIYAPK